MKSATRERDFFWIALIFCTSALVLLLWTRASDPRWLGHLQIDPVVFQTRAVSFLEHSSWAHSGTNEYQPGALWFFVATACGLEDPRKFDDFRLALLTTNAILLCLHILLAAVFGEKHTPWLLMILAAATGPILLYRFELLVSLLVLTGWLFWRRGHLNSCGFFMGLAMATKIYPILLAPLLLFGAWMSGKIRKGISSMFAWGLGLFGMTFSLLIFGAQSQELMSAIRFHINKPFGIDGSLGSFVPILQNFLDIPLRMAPRNGIHGFDSDLGGIATTAITWIWFPIALGVIGLILRKQRGVGYPNAGDLFVLMGVFVGLGKLMAPQYTWWALSLLPFAPAAWLSRTKWIAVMLLLVSSLLLGQIVYPLNYSEFIKSFSVNPLENPLFWINSAKNLMWLAAVGIATSGLFRGSR
ncbi:MAG: hypothetical protein NTW41_04540 [Verrucomicrobia bacterium]|nr:hypothetical protein [Verrucomicrobiota bacterium]